MLLRVAPSTVKPVDFLRDLRVRGRFAQGVDSMLQNKVVARYRDGRILKGYTGNFAPDRPNFHLVLSDAPKEARAVEVQIAELKAVFFVKSFAGDPQHSDAQRFEEGKTTVGRKIQVVFEDGETLVGTTQGYDPNRPGFFIKPADSASNNDRCFVVTRATKTISFL